MKPSAMNRFFQYLNMAPMPLWLAMMFFPNHRLTERAAHSSTVLGLAALHYVAALGVAMRQTEDQDKIVAGVQSLDGVRAMLGTRQGTLAAWAHMLALDLFTGAWIYRECRRLHAPAYVRIPALFFTLMTGPFGLVLFLLWRMTGGRRGEAIEH
jgi:hypothetical protein